MNCEKFRDIAFDLAAGQLSSGEEEEARKHIEACPECREEYEACRSMMNSLSELGEEQAPADLLPNVMKKIAKDKSRKRARIIQFGTAAAAAVLLVAGTVTVMPSLKKEAIEPNAQVTEDGEVGADGLNKAEAEPDTEPETSEDTQVFSGAVGYDAVTEADSGRNEPIQAQPDVPEVKTVQKTEQAEIAEEREEVPSENQIVGGAAPKQRSVDVSVAMFSDEDEDMAVKSGGSGGSSSDGASVEMDTGYAVAARHSDIEDEIIEETEERKFIRRTSEFSVSGENASLGLEVSTEGKTLAQVAAELDALGVRYEIYIVEDDYTEEYKTASTQRRAEIERLCAEEKCVIRQ
ncbi:MAG: anti-sigma factor family protein [Clostridia bacterium]